MNKKTVSISLPKIEGVELKSATVDLKKGVVVAEYREEEAPFEVKTGDFLTLKTDPSKVVIFRAMVGMIEGVAVFTITYDLPRYINGILAFTPKGVKMPISSFRHSTEEEKALMIEEMEKLGKRYNPETFKVEDIEKDISEIAVDLKSAIGYLHENPRTSYLDITKKLTPKLRAFYQLVILAEAWNSFDEFKPDWGNAFQCKYYPIFEFINGKFEFSHASLSRFISDTQVSSFSFENEDRAEQFGKQFIELFRIILSS